VDVGLLYVGLLLHTISDLKISALIVCAVAAADKLLELSLVREPGLKIKLLGGSVVCCAVSQGQLILGRNWVLGNTYSVRRKQ
jgi:hypothetical protein